MNWRVRLALILGSALALYLVLAWMIGDGESGDTAHAMDKRMQALEEAQALDRERLQALQEFQGRGTLFRLLVSDPTLGDSLLKDWDTLRLTAEMGWPDRVEGVVWTYDPRTPDGPGLQVVLADTRVQSVRVLTGAKPR